MPKKISLINGTTKKNSWVERFIPGPSFAEEFSANVLYEDNHVLGVYKPAGVLVQGDRTGRPTLLDMAKYWVKLKYQKPGNVFLGLVHRLDRPVAGVVMFARTSKAAGRLSAQFREHTVTKIYHAVIHGKIDPPQGVLKGVLIKHGTKMVVTNRGNQNGQYAELSYTTVDHGSGFSLLHIELLTGRRHQIRVQLAAEGHPIVGDTMYGSPVQFGQDTIALLAKSLTCRHPTKLMSVTIEAPLPPDWPWPPEKIAI